MQQVCIVKHLRGHYSPQKDLLPYTGFTVNFLRDVNVFMKLFNLQLIFRNSHVVWDGWWIREFIINVFMLHTHIYIHNTTTRNREIWYSYSDQKKGSFTRNSLQSTPKWLWLPFTTLSLFARPFAYCFVQISSNTLLRKLSHGSSLTCPKFTQLGSIKPRIQSCV